MIFLKKVSIIVPVYNAQAYLENTLSALQKALRKDMEIILVDDDSSDNSGKIIKAFQEADDRIRYIRIPNKGPGNARNKGLEIAEGKYICFCDADDLPDEKLYTTLVDYLEKQDADMAMCDYFSQRDNTNGGLPWADGSVVSNREVIAAMVGKASDGDAIEPIWGCVWRCIFKKSVIDMHGIRFPNTFHFAEDLVFTLRYLKRVKNVSICNQPLHFYVCNQQSLMNTFSQYKPGMFEARKALVQCIEEVIKGSPDENELDKRLAVTKRCYYKDCVGNACRPAAGRTGHDIKTELKIIFYDNDVRKAFKHFDDCDKKTKLSYLLIKYRMVTVTKWYYTWRFR